MGSNGIYQVGMNAEPMKGVTNRELRPYQPTLVEAERLMDEDPNGVDVPVAINDPGAEQDANEFMGFTAFGGVGTAARAETNA